MKPSGWIRALLCPKVVKNIAFFVGIVVFRAITGVVTREFSSYEAKRGRKPTAGGFNTLEFTVPKPRVTPKSLATSSVKSVRRHRCSTRLPSKKNFAAFHPGACFQHVFSLIFKQELLKLACFHPLCGVSSHRLQKSSIKQGRFSGGCLASEVNPKVSQRPRTS